MSEVPLQPVGDPRLLLAAGRRDRQVLGLQRQRAAWAGRLLKPGLKYQRSLPAELHHRVRHEPLWPNSHPFEDTLLAGSAAILCTGGLDVIRKEAWPFYRTISGVRLCWELEEPKGPNGKQHSAPRVLTLGPLGSFNSHHRRTPELVL